MEEPVAEKVSAVQQLKAVDEQRAKILETAKTDALTDLTPKPKAKATTTGNKREPSGNECGYCHFKTIPPHDKRSHRTQKKKRPFTDAELKELGMMKA